MSAARLDVATVERMGSALRVAADKMNPLSSWADTLQQIVTGPPQRGALKTWAHEGMEVETLQVTMKFDQDGQPTVSSAWSPGARLIEDMNTVRILWTTGSSAEFAGTHSYKSAPGLWCGGYEWGKNTLVLVIHRQLS